MQKLKSSLICKDPLAKCALSVLKRITGFSIFIMGIGVFAASFFSFGKYIFIGTLAFFIILNFILMMMFKKKNPEVQ
ncbi:MAG: hypothetical protein SO116_00920 [Treponema sp.]|nr:hypothetical protein [Treponema sp.]